MRRTDRKESIMRAAEQLFAERRFHEVTLEEVARVARVGKGTLYLHFKDKDDLFFQVALAGFDEMCAVLDRDVSRADSFADALACACRQIVSFFERRRSLFRMMQSEEDRARWCHGAIRERWMCRRGRLVGAVARILDHGVREGAVRGDLPTDVLALFLLGLLRTRARDMEPSVAPAPEAVADLFLRGAAATATDAAGAKRPARKRSSTGRKKP